MCSLQEAYQTFSEPYNPFESRNEDPERKKRKKRRTATLPPEPEVIEPDRPAHRRLPPVELLGGPVEENTKTTSISQMLNAAESADFFPHPSNDVNNEKVYSLEPDWAKAFNDNSAPEWIKERMPQRNAEVPLVPSPWLDGSSTLWQKIPESQSTQVNLRGAASSAESRLDELQRKLDHMFSKLEAHESGRTESNHIEIILFVLGGLFLLLLLDLLVKQGTQASLMLGMASGGSMTTPFMNKVFG